jgi:hypothetical protein
MAINLSGRPHALIVLNILIMAAGLSACANIGAPQPNAGKMQLGEPYYLPKAEAAIALGVPNDNNLTVSIDTVMVADTSAGLLRLVRTPGLLSADTVEIKVGANQLLTSVSSTSDSRAAEVATGLGEVIGRLESAVGDNVLVSDSFDPTSPDERLKIGQRLSVAIADWATREGRTLSARPTATSRLSAEATHDQKIKAQSEDAALRERAEFLAEASRTAIEVEWEWNPPPVQSPPANPPARVPLTEACGQGICIRGARPGRLRIFRCSTDAPLPPCDKARRVLVTTVVANIPNEAPVSGIAVYGGLFADTEHTLTLTDGMLQSYKTVRANEPEGLVTVAGNLLGAIFTGSVNAFTSEKQIVEAETSLLNAQTARLEALEKLKSAGDGGGNDGTDGAGGSPEGFLSEATATVGLFGPIDAPTPPPVANTVTVTQAGKPPAQSDGKTPAPGNPIIVPGSSGTQTSS